MSDKVEDPISVKDVSTLSVSELLWNLEKVEHQLRRQLDRWDAADVVEAAAARLRALTEWRPMDTAPRDGMWIFAQREGGSTEPIRSSQLYSPYEWWDGDDCGHMTNDFTGWLPLPGTEG